MLVLVAALLFVELGIFAFAPRSLARLAFLPLGLDATIPLDEGLQRAFTSEKPGGDYRRPPVRVLDEAKVRAALGSGMVGFVDAEAGFERGLVWVRVARGRRFWMGRPFLVASVRPTLVGGAIELSARVLPVPMLTIAAALASMVGPPFDLRVAAFAALVVVAIGAANALWNRALVRAVVDEAKARILAASDPRSQRLASPEREVARRAPSPEADPLPPDMTEAPREDDDDDVKRRAR